MRPMPLFHQFLKTGCGAGDQEFRPAHLESVTDAGEKYDGGFVPLFLALIVCRIPLLFSQG